MDYASTGTEFVLKNVRLPLTAAVISIFSVAPAYAADGSYDADVFAGGAVSYSKIDNLSVGGQEIDDLGDADNFQDDRSSWKAFAGVWLNDFVGIEGQYLDMGEYKEGSFSFDPSGFTGALMLGLPAGDHSRVYVKGGQFWWNADLKGPLGYDDEREGTAFFYGVGTSFAVLPQLNLRLEYERVDLDEDNVKGNVDFASAGLAFMF